MRFCHPSIHPSVQAKSTATQNRRQRSGSSCSSRLPRLYSVGLLPLSPLARRHPPALASLEPTHPQVNEWIIVSHQRDPIVRRWRNKRIFVPLDGQRVEPRTSLRWRVEGIHTSLFFLGCKYLGLLLYDMHDGPDNTTACQKQQGTSGGCYSQQHRKSRCRGQLDTANRCTASNEAYFAMTHSMSVVTDSMLPRRVPTISGDSPRDVGKNGSAPSSNSTSTTCGWLQ